jgi:hypothetical protein
MNRTDLVHSELEVDRWLQDGAGPIREVGLSFLQIPNPNELEPVLLVQAEKDHSTAGAIGKRAKGVDHLGRLARVVRGLHLDGIGLHAPLLHLGDQPPEFFNLHRRPSRWVSRR